MTRERWTVIFATWFNLVLVAGVAVYALLFARGGVAFEDGDIGQQVRDLLWFALLCGLASFATIEVLKRLVGLRGAYQMRETRRWLDQRTPDGWAAFCGLLDGMGLTMSATSGSVRRVFNLPTEQLAAQVSGAADVVLALPERKREKRHESLIAALAARRRPDDRSAAPSDAEQDDLDLELAQRVRAGVDQLQISLGEQWRRYVQGTALSLSGLYGAGLVEGAAVRDGAEARYVLAALFVGGAFAWIVRDIVAVIERSRG